MVVGVENGLTRIVDGQTPGISLTISVVNGATIGGELGRHLDERSGLGIRTDNGGIPESRADVDGSKLKRNWSRDFNISANDNLAIGRYTHGRRSRCWDWDRCSNR